MIDEVDKKCKTPASMVKSTLDMEKKGSHESNAGKASGESQSYLASSSSSQPNSGGDNVVKLPPIPSKKVKIVSPKRSSLNQDMIFNRKQIDYDVSPRKLPTNNIDIKVEDLEAFGQATTRTLVS